MNISTIVRHLVLGGLLFAFVNGVRGDDAPDGAPAVPVPGEETESDLVILNDAYRYSGTACQKKSAKGYCSKAPKHVCQPCRQRHSFLKGLWHHCKPVPPPYAPVVQSQAFQSVPPQTTAQQFKMELTKGNQKEDKDDPDKGEQQDNIQKASVTQPPRPLLASETTDARIERLESKMNILIEKMDIILGQDESLAERPNQRMFE